MLARRTTFVALINTRDWWDSTTNLFFSNRADISDFAVGDAGPMNIRIKLFTATTDAKNDITLTWEKETAGVWGDALGGVAEGLPGGAVGTYNAAAPVYTDDNHKWIIGDTISWLGVDGDNSAIFFAYVYLQFKNITIEDLGRYRAKATVDYDLTGAIPEVTERSFDFELVEGRTFVGVLGG